MYQILLVALGGALGAAVRYGTSVWVLRLWDEPVVLATWAVNLVGCLLIGMLAPLLGRVGLADELQFFLVVGFLGLLLWFGADMTQRASRQQSAALEWSMSIPNAAIPLGAALMLYHLAAGVARREGEGVPPPPLPFETRRDAR